MKYFLLSALVATLLFTACNKTPTSTNTTESILRTGTWHLTSGTVSLRLPNGLDTSIDYVSLIVPICHKDDYLKFYSGTFGGVYPGATSCSAADADSVSYGWSLVNSNTGLYFYNSQLLYYSLYETVQPFHIDTLSHTPLVLDSLTFDNGTSEIDSIHTVIFTEKPAAPTNANNLVDITNSTLSNVTSGGFTLTFSTYSTYPDTTNHHQNSPISRADTFHYTLNYSNQ